MIVLWLLFIWLVNINQCFKFIKFKTCFIWCCKVNNDDNLISFYDNLEIDCCYPTCGQDTINNFVILGSMLPAKGSYVENKKYIRRKKKFPTTQAVLIMQYQIRACHQRFIRNIELRTVQNPSRSNCEHSKRHRPNHGRNG